jgi:hypothetical protein
MIAASAFTFASDALIPPETHKITSRSRLVLVDAAGEAVGSIVLDCKTTDIFSLEILRKPTEIIITCMGIHSHSIVGSP